jgi:hypothetical protein
MKPINSLIHGVLDYVVVIFLFASPTLFDLSDFVTTMTYALGGVHLLLTLITDFKLGLIKVLPLKIHGVIELIVSIALVLSPWILGFDESPTDRLFYVAFGVAVFITWTLTDYAPGNS